MSDITYEQVQEFHKANVAFGALLDLNDITVNPVTETIITGYRFDLDEIAAKAQRSNQSVEDYMKELRSIKYDNR